MELVKCLRIKGRLINFDIYEDLDFDARLGLFSVEFDDSNHMLCELKLNQDADTDSIYFILENDSRDFPFILSSYLKCGNKVYHEEEYIHNDTDSFFFLRSYESFVGRYKKDEFMKNFVNDGVVDYEIVLNFHTTSMNPFRGPRTLRSSSAAVLAESICFSNWLEFYYMAMRFRSEELEEACVSFFMLNHQEIMNTSDWNNLSASHRNGLTSKALKAEHTIFETVDYTRFIPEEPLF